MLKMKEKFLCLIRKLCGISASLRARMKKMNSISSGTVHLMRKANRSLASFSSRFFAESKKIGRLLLRHRIAAAVVGSALVMSMLLSVITVSIRRVEITDDGASLPSFSTIATDEESILRKAGLTLSAEDKIAISKEQGVIRVAITRAFPVTVCADGETILMMFTGGTVADALEKAGLSCGNEDILSHPAADPLTSGMQITLDRVTNDQAIQTVSIDYDTIKKETNDLYVGQTKLVQKGEKGEKELIYTVSYLNGKESGRELLSSKITKEPTDRIILVGTKVKSSFKKTSSTPASYKKVIAMTATAYAAGGTTATGRPAKWGVVAVDPRVIPLGSTVYVESADGKYIYGTAVAADTGGAIKGNKIDICVNTNAEANAFGRRTVNVYIIK